MNSIVIEKLQKAIDSYDFDHECEISIFDSTGVTIAFETFQPEYLRLEEEDLVILMDGERRGYCIPYALADSDYDEDQDMYIFKANGNEYWLNI